MNTSTMQLNALTISRNSYAFPMGNTAPGEIAGQIKFGGRNGHEVTLVLTPEQIHKILGIVAESMVETTKDLAQNLTREIIENTPLRIEGG